jgi:sugar lactone lactonase YvrE
MMLPIVWAGLATAQAGLFEDWKGIPSNVAFGVGTDGNTLYVTIDKSLFRIRVKTQGYHPQLPPGK